MEAAAVLQEKLRKADEEAHALRMERERIDQEKAKLSEAAARQKKQSAEEVSW